MNYYANLYNHSYEDHVATWKIFLLVWLKDIKLCITKKIAIFFKCTQGGEKPKKRNFYIVTLGWELLFFSLVLTFQNFFNVVTLVLY